MHRPNIAQVLGWFLVACAPAVMTSAAPAEEELVPWGTFSKGTVGPWRCPEVALLRSADEWDTWIGAIPEDCLYLRPPAPEVSWDHLMLVVVTLGEKRFAGYGVDVVEVRRSDQRLLIDAHETMPAEGSHQQLFNTPFHVVSVDRRAVDDIELQWVLPDTITALRGTTWGRLKLGAPRGP